MSGSSNRLLVLLWALVGLFPAAAFAACPAAPVGSTSDTVVILKHLSDSAGIGPVSRLDATREGGLVYDSAEKVLKYCDGTNWVALEANEITAPAFMVDKNGTDQASIASGVITVVTFARELYDTTNEFDLATERFTPSTAGYYIVTGNLFCTTTCTPRIFKNGAQVAVGTMGPTGSATSQIGTVTAFVYLNGTTDYIDLRTWSNNTHTITGTIGHTYFTAILVAPSGSAGGGVGVTDGDKGDITVASSGASWTIDNNAVVTADIADGNVTMAKLVDSAAGLSVVGRSANTAGDFAEITAASDGQVLRRSGTSVGFGAIDLASVNAVTGVLPPANLGTGTADIGTYLRGNGTWATYPVRVELAGVTATGTSIDFTSIPSYVTKINIFIDGLSSNGSDEIIVRLGTSSGLQTTGYTSRATNHTGSVVPANTTGLIFEANGAAANINDYHIVLTRFSGNRWNLTSIGNGDNVAHLRLASGSATLSGVLDRLSIVPTGANSFDSGTVYVSYE